MDQSSRWSSAKDNSIHGKSWILLELENPAVVGELGGLRLFFLSSWFGFVLSMLLLVFGGVGSEGVGLAGFTCSLVLRGYLELSMWLYYNKIVWSSVRWRASVKR